MATSTNPIDILSLNPHIVIDEMYAYTGGFRSGAYLNPHAIEKRFSERASFSHMVNFFAPVVDAMVRPVFDGKQIRQTDNEKMRGFISNCDVRGTPLKAFMRGAATECRKHSSVFIVVDNLAADEMPATDAEATETRAYPYVYLKKPQDVRAFKVDRFGRCESVTFANGVYTEETKDGLKEYPRFLYMDRTTFRDYYEQTSKDGTATIVLGETAHPLGVVPCVMMEDNSAEGLRFVPEPKLYGLMRICHAVFNKDSEMREIERKQEFSSAIFYTDNPTPLSVGVGNAVILGRDDKSPHFLEPNVGILTGLLETRTALREDLYRVAEQNGVVGVQAARSGTAMAYEFMARDSILRETAEICEAAERRVADLFFRWIGEAYDYVVEYDESYTPADDAVLLKWIDIAMMAELPDEIKAQISKVIARKINPKISDEELALIDDAAAASADEAAIMDAESEADITTEEAAE